MENITKNVITQHSFAYVIECKNYCENLYDYLVIQQKQGKHKSYDTTFPDLFLFLVLKTDIVFTLKV